MGPPVRKLTTPNDMKSSRDNSKSGVAGMTLPGTRAAPKQQEAQALHFELDDLSKAPGLPTTSTNCAA